MKSVLDSGVHTLQSLHMATFPPLQPTLWRSCRVLANRRRLQIFSLLVPKRSLTVSAVAQRLKLALPVASQYLRGLEARGFLKARRVGDRVYYGLSAADALRPARLLVPALRVALRGDSGSVEKAFKLATAFTHPRRIEIFRALERGGRTVGQLRALPEYHVLRWAATWRRWKRGGLSWAEREATRWRSRGMGSDVRWRSWQADSSAAKRCRLCKVCTNPMSC
jgi:DNA-binding transcriptional ArsR family regulator